MQDRALAEHICLVHNSVVPLFNAAVQSRELVLSLRSLLQVPS
jgi:hypothetical protein